MEERDWQSWGTIVENGIVLDNESLLIEFAEWLRVHATEDQEVAHALEDELRRQFIVKVTENAYTSDQIRARAEQLKTISELEFARWYA